MIESRVSPLILYDNAHGPDFRLVGAVLAVMVHARNRGWGAT